MRRTVAVLVLAGGLLAAGTSCTSSDTDDTGPTTVTATDDMAGDDALYEAVHSCVDDMSGLGVALLASSATEANQAQEVCAAALVRLDPDDNNALTMDSVAWTLALTIDDRRSDVADAVVSAGSGTLTAADAAALDSDYLGWRAEVERLLKYDLTATIPPGEWPPLRP